MPSRRQPLVDAVARPATRRGVVAGGLALGLSAPSLARAAAAPFPTRPLVIMAPANPGGGWDQLARLMQHVIGAEKLSDRPIEVMNKGGAGGAIGLADLVSRRHGDPYMIMAAGLVMIGSTISQKSPFRMSDTEPLARLFTEHLIVAVPAASPYKTMEEFFAAFRSDPASISWCGGSAGGVDHILVGMIAEAAGVPASNLRYVAYSGGGEASSAILGGQVSVGVNGYSEWKGLADAGRVRILAAATEQRFADKTIPTLRESGINVVFENWRGVFAAPGIAPEHKAWWMSVLNRMRGSEAWRTYLTRNGWDDAYLTGDDFKRFILQEEASNGRTLARLGIGVSGGGNAPVGPWAFPIAIGAAGTAATALVVAEHLRAKPGEAIVLAGAEDDDDGGGPTPLWPRFLAGAGLMLAYILALNLIGFLIATPLFVVALCLLMRTRTLIWDVVSAAGLTGGIWLLFTRFLSVHLP
jgi:putative tricarboxylic transport membrane protein